MTTKNRSLRLVAAFGLAAGALVSAAPAATAATPSCPTVMMAVDQNERIVVRSIDAGAVVTNKLKANSMQSDIKSIIWLDSVKVNAGLVAHVNIFQTKGSPNYSSVTIPEASDVLTVKKTKEFVDPSFAARSLTGSGSYYIYGISQAGNLTRWTRFHDSRGRVGLGAPKVVATGMSAVRTLQYSWTYPINGKQTDFLVATSTKGVLEQIRIPWSSPASETVKVLAASGFSSIDGLALSFCTDNDNYLSIIAVDNKQNSPSARWLTLYDLKHPKPSALVDRGQVSPEVNWYLHAVT